MDLIAYARILRRRWWLLAALTGVGLLLAGATWVSQRDDGSLYRATHTLVASNSNVNLDQAAALATAGQVPERAAARLGDTPGELTAKVRVNARRDVGFVDVTAFGSDPTRTAEVADVLAEELATYERELKDAGASAQIETYEQRLAELQTEIDDLAAQVATAPDEVTRDEVATRLAARRNEIETIQQQLDSLRATALTTTVLDTVSAAEAVPISGPQLRQLFEASDGGDAAAAASAITGSPPLGLAPRLALGGAFGLLAGVGAALLLERLDPRLRTKDDAERIFGWPVLTEVPPLSRKQQEQRAVLSASEPRSRTAEAYRVLRSSIVVAAGGATAGEDRAAPTAATTPDEPDEAGSDEGRVVLITSASPTEGKTTTVANLAAVMGEAGARVLVVNCDFRRPALGAYLGVDPHLARVVPTDVGNVWLLAQVTDDPEHANPSEVIELQRRVVHEARRRFDVVLLDTAPLLTTNDANEVLGTADVIVVVARAGRTTREGADRCAETLERRGAPVLGVVLVAAADAPAGRYYYYGDYYVDDAPHRPASHDQTDEVLVGATPPSPPEDRMTAATTDERDGDGTTTSTTADEPDGDAGTTSTTGRVEDREGPLDGAATPDAGSDRPLSGAPSIAGDRPSTPRDRTGGTPDRDPSGGRPAAPGAPAPTPSTSSGTSRAGTSGRGDADARGPGRTSS